MKTKDLKIRVNLLTAFGVWITATTAIPALPPPCVGQFTLSEQNFDQLIIQNVDGRFKIDVNATHANDQTTAVEFRDPPVTVGELRANEYIKSAYLNPKEEIAILSVWRKVGAGH